MFTVTFLHNSPHHITSRYTNLTFFTLQYIVDHLIDLTGFCWVKVDFIQLYCRYRLRQFVLDYIYLYKLHQHDRCNFCNFLNFKLKFIFFVSLAAWALVIELLLREEEPQGSQIAREGKKSDLIKKIVNFNFKFLNLSGFIMFCIR